MVMGNILHFLIAQIISDNGASGTVNFSDSSAVGTSFSTNYSVSYLWDFGDGTTSTQQNPCHTYGDLSNVSFPLYVTWNRKWSI